MAEVSIVVVTFNSSAHVEACLESIARTIPPLAHEVVVVDNASTDGTADRVRARWPGVQVLASATNAGFAAACNAGIRRSSGRLILLLNPDAVLQRDAVARLIAALDADRDAAIAGPRLVDERGRVELSFGRMLSPWSELRQKLLVRGSQRGHRLATAWVARLTGRSRVVDWVSGACLLVRRADAEAVGLLDERYFLYEEDVDFCAAVRARGRRVLFVGEAEVVHVRGQSAVSQPALAGTAYRRSQLAFYAKHRPAWVPVLRAYLRLRGRLPS